MSLLDFANVGVSRPPLATALQRPERARKVSLYQPSKDVLELARVYTLELGRAEVPPWLDKLVHLRTLIWAAPVKTLPAVLAKLPRLRYLHLEDSQLESLEGLERLPALETITVGRTPVQDKDGALAAAAKRVNGEAGSWSIDVPRKRAKPAAKNLAKALQADDVPDDSDLRAVDLAGKTFEDLYVTHDLRKAKLARTTWRRCDFERAKLAGADLTGATFEDCYFSSAYDEGMFEKAKLAGAKFVRCGGTFEFAKADLRDATFTEMESDAWLALDGAKAKGLVLHATFCSEKEHHITAKGADLRGATITFDITADRRSAIGKKKTGRLAWRTDHLTGAKTDASTKVTYAPLPGAKQEVASSIDPEGPAAKSLGEIHAPNASLWVLAIDAEDAMAWRGDTQKPSDDFQRALGIGDGKIKVGKATAMLAHITDRGWSYVWEVDGGIALVDGSVKISKPQERDHAMALRVAQWAPVKPKKVGSIAVKSGVLALLLPFRDGTFTAAELKQAKGGKIVKDAELDRILVPLPKGTYDIVVHPFGPAPNYEDDIGSYTSVTRFVRK